ncbi:hypothetical protein [Nocardia wallacei]|uniref:hypothetical protein n=1 Tax=Nocardia wallacei TaxID=480035 RepID=UPI002454989B|nr:hypothetical protein [Nocardia wallacei]
MTSPIARPTDCAPVLDFRAECTPATSAQPAPTDSPHEVIRITPEAPPIPGADSGPLKHLDGLHLPDIDASDLLHAAEVTAAFGGAVGAVTTAAMVAGSSWLFAWTPVRLRNFAFGAGLLPASSLALDGWHGPGNAVAHGAAEVAAGMPITGIASASVVLVPAGWMMAALMSARFAHILETRGRKSMDRTKRSEWARQQRQQRSAARLSRTELPLTRGTANPRIVIGRAARRVSVAPAKSVTGRLAGRHDDVFTVDWLAFGEHFSCVGGPGSGKTTAMDRMILSWWTTGWRRHTQWWRTDRPGRPLAIVLDLKGAQDARRNARKVAAAAMRLGIPAERIGIFPDETHLSLWTGTAEDMRPRFEALIGAGVDATGMDPAEAYYMQARKTLLHLVIDMPDRAKKLGPGENPPRDSVEFMRRMNKNVLVKGWAGHDGEQDEITAITYEGKTTPILLSERSAMANLFRELGSALDGDRDLAEFDLVYCCLEGTTAPILAKAQFAALISMVFALAGRDHGRAVHLFCDEFAQVCGDEGAARTVELLRSAGCGSGWFTQSWMGLGPNDDARHRLLDSCSGGVFVMRSYSAGQLAEKIGTRPTFAKSRKLIGGTRDGDEGNVQPDDSFIVPPAVLASFAPGDIVHVIGGKATFGHVSALDPDQVRPLPGLTESTTPQADQATVTEGA